MQQIFGLLLICSILFIRMGSILIWRDSEFSQCLGYNQTESPDKDALSWIEYVLKGQILQLHSNPTESIAASGVELVGLWECIKFTANVTDFPF